MKFEIQSHLMRSSSETVVLLCSGVLAVSHAVNVEYMTGNNKPIEYQDFEGAQVSLVERKGGEGYFYIYPLTFTLHSSVFHLYIGSISWAVHAIG